MISPNLLDALDPRTKLGQAILALAERLNQGEGIASSDFPLKELTKAVNKKSAALDHWNELSDKQKTNLQKSTGILAAIVTEFSEILPQFHKLKDLGQSISVIEKETQKKAMDFSSGLDRATNSTENFITNIGQATKAVKDKTKKLEKLKERIEETGIQYSENFKNFDIKLKGLVNDITKLRLAVSPKEIKDSAKFYAQSLRKSASGFQAGAASVRKILATDSPSQLLNLSQNKAIHSGFNTLGEYGDNLRRFQDISNIKRTKSQIDDMSAIRQMNPMSRVIKAMWEESKGQQSRLTVINMFRDIFIRPLKVAGKMLESAVIRVLNAPFDLLKFTLGKIGNGISDAFTFITRGSDGVKQNRIRRGIQKENDRLTKDEALNTRLNAGIDKLISSLDYYASLVARNPDLSSETTKERMSDLENQMMQQYASFEEKMSFLEKQYMKESGLDKSQEAEQYREEIKGSYEAMVEILTDIRDQGGKSKDQDEKGFFGKLFSKLKGLLPTLFGGGFLATIMGKMKLFSGFLGTQFKRIPFVAGLWSFVEGFYDTVKKFESTGDMFYDTLNFIGSISENVVGSFLGLIDSTVNGIFDFLNNKFLGGLIDFKSNLENVWKTGLQTIRDITSGKRSIGEVLKGDGSLPEEVTNPFSPEEFINNIGKDKKPKINSVLNSTSSNVVNEYNSSTFTHEQLQQMAEFKKYGFVVTSHVRKGNPKSKHFDGRAVDFAKGSIGYDQELSPEMLRKYQELESFMKTLGFVGDSGMKFGENEYKHRLVPHATGRHLHVASNDPKRTAELVRIWNQMDVSGSSQKKVQETLNQNRRLQEKQAQSVSILRNGQSNPIQVNTNPIVQPAPVKIIKNEPLTSIDSWMGMKALNEH